MLLMLLLIVDVSNPRFPHMVQQSNSTGMETFVKRPREQERYVRKIRTLPEQQIQNDF
jgi:hypothetical protein